MSIDQFFGGQPPAPSPGQYPAQPQQPAPAQGYPAQPQLPAAPGYGQQPAPQGYPAPQPGFGAQPQQAVNPAWADAIMGATAPHGGAPYLRGTGVSVMDIAVVKAKPRRENPMETVFFIEGPIVESTLPGLVSSERSISRKIPGNNNMGANDVRGWIEAIVNGYAQHTSKPPAQFSTQWLHAIAGPDQPFKGTRIKITSEDVPSSKGIIDPKTGQLKVFTKIRVEYLPPGTVLGLQAQQPAPQAPAPGQFAAQPQALPPQGQAPGFSPHGVYPAPAPAPAPQGYAPVPGQQPPAPQQVQYPAAPPPGWPAGVPYPPQG